MMTLADCGYTSVGIEINGTCNFKCKYCVLQLCRAKGGFMPLEKVRHILDQIKALGGCRLDGVNLNVLGEPMMHPDIFKILRYMRNNHLPSKLVTNGSLLNPENLTALAEDPPDIMHVSMDVLNGEKFARLRGTSASFDAYLQSVIELIALAFRRKIKGLALLELDVMCKFYTGVRRLIGALPEESLLPEIYARKNALYKDLIFFFEKLARAVPEFALNKNALKKNIAGCAYFILNKPLYAIADSIMLVMKEYLPLAHFDKKNVACDDKACYRQHLVICSNGNVSLCCIDYGQEIIAGNIFDESLEAILAASQEIAAKLASDATAYRICRQCKGYFSKGQKIIEPLLYKHGLRQYRRRHQIS